MQSCRLVVSFEVVVVTFVAPPISTPALLLHICSFLLVLFVTE